MLKLLHEAPATSRHARKEVRTENRHGGASRSAIEKLDLDWDGFDSLTLHQALIQQ